MLSLGSNWSHTCENKASANKQEMRDDLKLTNNSDQNLRQLKEWLPNTTD